MKSVQLAANVWESGGGGSASGPAAPWRWRPVSLLASGGLEQFVTPTNIIVAFGVVVVVCVVLGGLIAVRSVALKEIKAALHLPEEEKRVKVSLPTPLVVKKEMIFATTDDLEKQVLHMGNTIAGIENRVNETCIESRQTITALGQEMRGALQQVITQGEARGELMREQLAEHCSSASAGTAKVHERVDRLAERLGEVVGELKHVAQAANAARDAAVGANQRRRT